MGLKSISTLLLSLLVVWSTFINTASYTGLHNAAAFEYTFDTDADDLGLTITDVATGISNVRTLFIHEEHSVRVKGIRWTINKYNTNASSSSISSSEDVMLLWSTVVDGVIVTSGNISLTNLGQLLPNEFEAGNFVVTNNGKHSVKVIMTIRGDTASELVVSNSYVAYKSGVSIIPMILVLIMAMSTHLVRYTSVTIVCFFHLWTVPTHNNRIAFN